MKRKRAYLTPIEFVREGYPHADSIVWYQNHVVRRVDGLGRHAVTCSLYCGERGSSYVGKYDPCLIVEPLNYSQLREQCITLIEMMGDDKLLETLLILRGVRE